MTFTDSESKKTENEADGSAETTPFFSSEFTSTDNGHVEKSKGLSWVVTGLFLSGELAGAGVIALPLAVRNLGVYFGLMFLLVCAAMCIYTSMALGRSFLILQKHWPVYRHHCRDPYAQLGYRSYGTWMKRLVEITLNFGSLPATVILIVISANNLGDLIHHFAGYDLDYCYSAIIITLLVSPMSLLKSPQDFWWALVIGMVCTMAAVTLAIFGISNDLTVCQDTFTTPSFQYTSAFASLGNVVLSYGGHAAFPTVQNDMKSPHKFTYSAAFAFSLITCLYFPISLAGNLAYNENLSSTVIRNIQMEWVQNAVNILITIHCCLTVVLIINPVMQTVEELLHAPHKFGIHRIVIRFSMMALLLFIAETFPEFGPLMALAGGVFTSTTSFVFPAMFYLKLNVLDKKLNEKKTKKLMESAIEEKPSESVQIVVDEYKVGLMESLRRTQIIHLIPILCVIVVGLFVMVMATAFAVMDIATVSFQVPCYLRWIDGIGKVNNFTKESPTVCCGQYSNISLGTCTPLHPLNQYERINTE
ncbi:unnamed protein product [Bursaphelenchus xylophilus]|uniref:(pine wood nematode) hypothetical protein n=1 Tax=Bursaphelenchus xylophilus TaxID=6326 RepID=A0A1I7STL2_BURXY|nr:unnamed protein product [Bursaphelenchus xylophilus]CAG9108268.1 unnamed protein product [Bursaphelenchus xylophilus]